MKAELEPRKTWHLGSILGGLPELGRWGDLAAHAQRALLWGADGVYEAASTVAAFADHRGAAVTVVDGANAFDPYMVSRYAVKRGLDPAEVLRHVRIARAFTCYQLATLLCERLAAVPPDGPALVVLLGPCTTFFDENVPLKDAQLLFQRMLRRVEELGASGLLLFMAQSLRPMNRRRRHLLRRLFRSADVTLQLRPRDVEGRGGRGIALDEAQAILPGVWGNVRRPFMRGNGRAVEGRRHGTNRHSI